jgi:choline dehydrogenase-like flavoprotein
LENKSARKTVIVVGGGTAGIVIANRLENFFNVTIFEKSSNKNLPLLNRFPLLIGLLYSKPNKFIKKISLPLGPSRKVPYYVSNVLGGSSVINGCVHVMGSELIWNKVMDRFGLKAEDLKNSYRRLYSKCGEKNKISIKLAQKSNLDKIFFKVLESYDVPFGDVEWMTTPRCGTLYNTVNNFIRSSVRSLGNAGIVRSLINLEVDYLLVNDNFKIIGVAAGGKFYFADYVILSAGVIGTNTLLLKKVMRFSDKKFFDLNLSVGNQIKDHTNLRINVVSTKKIASLNELAVSIPRKIYLFLRHVLGIKTLMIGTGATSAAHLDLDGDGEIDTRIQLLNFSETGRIGSDGSLFSSSKPGFSISITAIHPKSYGKISVSPKGLKVDPGYLLDKDDVDHLRRAVKFVFKILQTYPLSEYVKEIDCREIIENFPDDYIFLNAYSGYHLLGGCSEIIDRDFKVRSLGNLFICDASAMSEYISSNIHSSVAILADMFSSKFIKEYSAI